jgi:hypothetical protein
MRGARVPLLSRYHFYIGAILVAAACAVPMEDGDTTAFDVPATGGTGGDMAGMPATGGGNPMGGGGVMANGGASAGRVGTGGDGGRGQAGTGGSIAGRASGGSAGAVGGSGRGGSGGVNAFGGTAGMSSNGGRSAGGMGADGGRAGGGRGSGGMVAGGRGGRGGAAGSGGAAGTSGGQTCVTSLMPGEPSGNLGTGAVCFDIIGTMMGWQVSNLGTRTLTVNDAKAPVPPAVPPAVGGHRIFQFGAAPAGDSVALNTAWSYW